MPIYFGRQKVSYQQKTGGGEIVPVPTPSTRKKAVNFYDYEGTLLHSYTRDEALGLSELPSLPDRTSENLTCQGWNYTPENIKNDLTENAEDRWIDVGAVYIPTDDATHINITFADKYRNVMPLMFKGNVTIDWGDGNTQIVNHTSATTITHEYKIAQSYPAKYTIKLTVNSGTLTFGSSSNKYNICGSITDNASNPASAYSSRIDSVFIGNGVTSIGQYAFQNCYSIASVTIPNSVTSISDDAFCECRSLASVTIPNSVTSIGHGAFEECYSLTSISIPSGVKSIGLRVFSNCSSLASVTIPNGITSISNSAFYYCYSLASISIPNGVTSIGNNAFYNCYSLASITIPDGVTSIGYSVFQNCYSLASATIPNSVTRIGYRAFQFCRSLASVTIPNSVTIIDKETFDRCFSLASITIPNSVTSIGTYAFYYCFSLASITIPNSVTSIGTYAFFNCSSLASITIPDGVTSIGQGTFQYCYGIIKYDFSTHTSIPTLSNTDAFTSIAADAKIVVPDALYDEWIAATNWSTYVDYIVKVSEYVEPQYVPPHTIITYTNGSIKEVEVGDDGILTQTLIRNAGDYTTIQSVEIGSDVTSIGDSAFYRCTSLTSVTIPSSVTSIGDYAFYNCSSLTSLTIPDSVTSIGWSAFSDCSGLTNIILENRTLEEAQSLIGTSTAIGYTGTVTYNGGTYNTVNAGGSHNGGADD